MQVQLRMSGQELSDPPGLMGREVVGDDVDLATLGLQRNNLALELPVSVDGIGLGD